MQIVLFVIHLPQVCIVSEESWYCSGAQLLELRVVLPGAHPRVQHGLLRGGGGALSPRPGFQQRLHPLRL